MFAGIDALIEVKERLVTEGVYRVRVRVRVEPALAATLELIVNFPSE